MPSDWLMASVFLSKTLTIRNTLLKTPFLCHKNDISTPNFGWIWLNVTKKYLFKLNPASHLRQWQKKIAHSLGILSWTCLPCFIKVSLKFKHSLMSYSCSRKLNSALKGLIPMGEEFFCVCPFWSEILIDSFSRYNCDA